LPNEDSEDRHIYITDYLDADRYLSLAKSSYGSVSELWLKNDNDFDYVYEALNRIKEKEPTKIKAIYTRRDIPDRFAIKAKNRLANYILLAKTGYQVILEVSGHQILGLVLIVHRNMFYHSAISPKSTRSRDIMEIMGLKTTRSRCGGYFWRTVDRSKRTT
jgi:hypothetical protein